MLPEDLIRIKHMLEAAQRIIRFTEKRTRQDLEADEQFSDAVIRRLQVIGEAARKISQKTQDQFPDIHWKHIIGMRNRLVHEYFEIDYEVIWRTIQHSLPELLAQLQELVAENPLSSTK